MDADTAHLIRQAAHEIGINRDGSNPVEVEVAEVTATATFRNRHGVVTAVTVVDGTTFSMIHEALRMAWRDKGLQG
jgi:rare lipoprotein A (peptidoglycan hydrolase)